MEKLDREGFTNFNEIVSLMEGSVPENIEVFLNNLVRKGYLEVKGCLRLKEYPFVSVIIPVRNRPEEITVCLESLSRLDYPQEKTEIIVVDDASDDNTADAVSSFPVQLVSLRGQGGASYCRNLGAEKARGEILAFLDSDCMAGPLWLRELVPAFIDSSTGAVGGMVDSYFNERGLDLYEKVRSSLNMGPWPRSSRDGNVFFYLPSCSLLARRDLFLPVGGFREDMTVGEDVDLCWRLQDKGYHIEYRPVGRVFHKHRNRMRHFCARRFDYGTSEPLLQKYNEKRSKKIVFPIPDLLFWGFALLSIISGRPLILALSGATLLTDSLIKLVRIVRMGIGISYPRVLLVSLRSYLAFIYSLCTFVSRYYLIWAFLLFFVFPVLSAAVMGAHLLTGTGEYFMKKPGLNFPLFLFYFSLDQMSYQLGVWWGCIRRFFFRPVNPRIVIRSFLKESV